MDFAALMESLPEDQRGLISAEISKRNNEAANLRQRTKAVEGMFGKLKEKLGVDEIDDEVLDRLASSTKASGTADETLKKLQKQLEKETARASELDRQHRELSQSVRVKDRNEQITAALGKAGVRPDALSAALKIAAADAAWDEDEGVWKFDGKDLAGYMKAFQTSNPYLLANPVGAGTKSAKDAAGGTKAGTDFISKEQFEAMTDEERKANYKLIRKSMGQWK